MPPSHGTARARPRVAGGIAGRGRWWVRRGRGGPGSRRVRTQPRAAASAPRKRADAAAPLALEGDDLEQLTNLAAAAVERPEQAEHLFDGQLVAELRLLQVDAEPFPQLTLARRPCESENLDVSPVRREETLEDLDRRRFPGPVRTEETKALATPDVQRQTGHGDDVTVAFLEIVTLHRQVMHEVSLQNRNSCPQTAAHGQRSLLLHCIPDKETRIRKSQPAGRARKNTDRKNKRETSKTRDSGKARGTDLRGRRPAIRPVRVSDLRTNASTR